MTSGEGVAEESAARDNKHSDKIIPVVTALLIFILERIRGDSAMVAGVVLLAFVGVFVIFEFLLAKFEVQPRQKLWMRVVLCLVCVVALAVVPFRGGSKPRLRVTSQENKQTVYFQCEESKDRFRGCRIYVNGYADSSLAAIRENKVQGYVLMSFLRQAELGFCLSPRPIQFVSEGFWWTYAIIPEEIELRRGDRFELYVVLSEDRVAAEHLGRCGVDDIVRDLNLGLMSHRDVVSELIAFPVVE